MSQPERPDLWKVMAAICDSEINGGQGA